jgi:hypothetical protein
LGGPGRFTSHQVTKDTKTPRPLLSDDIVISFFYMEDKKFGRLEAGVSATARSFTHFVSYFTAKALVR